MATQVNGREKIVLLVTTDILRPYKKDEIIGVPESIARKLLNVNMTDEFGQVYRPKVRLYNEISDKHLELKNGTLNQEESEKLLRKLHPELADDDDDDFDDEDDDEVEESLDSTEAANEFERIAKSRTATAQKRGRGRPKGSTNRKS